MVLSVRIFVLFLFFLFSFFRSDSSFGFNYDEYLEELRKKNPTLYNFEKRLKDIHENIQETIKDYQEGEIDREELKDKLKSLIKEEIEIINNPEYIVEKRLEAILHSLPPQKTAPIKIRIYPEK